MRRANEGTDLAIHGGDKGAASSGSAPRVPDGSAESAPPPKPVQPDDIFVPIEPPETTERTEHMEDVGRGAEDHGVSYGPPERVPEEMELDLARQEDRESEQDLRAMLVVFAKENRQEAKQRYGEAMALVASMGRPGRKFRREATRRTRAIVSELYSAPRVTDAAETRALRDHTRTSPRPDERRRGRWITVGLQ